MPGTPSLFNRKRKNYFAREAFILKICGIYLQEHEPFVYKVYSFIVRYLAISYPFACLADLNKHGFNEFAQTLVGFFGTVIAKIDVKISRLVKIGAAIQRISFHQDFHKKMIITKLDGHVTLFLIVSLGCLNFFAASASVTLHRYRLKLGKLLGRLEEEPFLPNANRSGAEEDKLISEWALALMKQGFILYVNAVLIVIGGMLYSIVKRIRSSDSSEWINTFVYGPLTILDVTRSPNYEISWIYQNVAITYFGFTLCTVIVMLSAILAYICTQFQMLQSTIRKMPKYYHGNSIKMLNTTASPESSSPLEIQWTYLRSALREVVCYHINILEIIAEVDAVFNSFMLSLFVIMVCMLCFIIYATSILPLNDPGIAILGLQTLVCINLPLIVCYWGEHVAHESEQVGRAVYEANFVGVDIRFQKALNLIVLRSQRPARIKAGKLVDTSMATFVWIVRTSISYFMIARNFNKEQ